MFDFQRRITAHPLLNLLAITAFVMAGCGGGGGNGENTAAPAPVMSQPVPAVQAVVPVPFWGQEVPVRPSLAHLFSPAFATRSDAHITALSADEVCRVQEAAAQQPTEQRAALPAGVAVQRRTVTGLFSDSYHTTTGASQVVQELSFSAIEAIAPNGSGGFERIPATSKRTDGSYLIAGVPEGLHWVRIDNTFVWTDAPFIDWGSDVFGRADNEYALSPTLLTINAASLNGWQAGDQLAWNVPMQGTSVPLTLANSLVMNPPAPGDTALAGFGLDFDTTPADALSLPLLSAAKGDQAYLNQLGTSPGNDYRTLVKSLVLPALTQTDGTPRNVNSAFLDLAQSSALRLKWDRPAFASRAAEVNPTAVASSSVLGLTTSALAPNYGVPSDAFSLVEFNTFGSTALDFGRVHYGNPFPADWSQVMESYYGFTVHYMAPGATVALPFERFLYGVDLVPTGTDPALNLRPRMTPVLSPRVNGKTLFSNQLAVGMTPRFTWLAPAVGAPDRYLVTLRHLFANGPRSTSRSVGRFYTSDTSVDVPPGLMQSGEVYFITISAIAAGTPLSEPARSKLPYAFATMMSALISP